MFIHEAIIKAKKLNLKYICQTAEDFNPIDITANTVDLWISDLTDDSWDVCNKETKMDKPDYKTLEKYNLIWHGGKPMEPKFIGNAYVFWWNGATEDQINETYPTYAIYESGTNSITVLEKRKDKTWEKVKFEDVKNWYGLLWKMLLTMPDYKEPEELGFIHCPSETIEVINNKDVTKLTME